MFPGDLCCFFCAGGCEGQGGSDAADVAVVGEVVECMVDGIG